MCTNINRLMEVSRSRYDMVLLCTYLITVLSCPLMHQFWARNPSVFFKCFHNDILSSVVTTSLKYGPHLRSTDPE
jgi:hypothetical protein